MNGGPTLTTQYTPCRWCIWYDRPGEYDSHSYCCNPRCAKVRTTPDLGCSCWERAPGLDDDADPEALPYAKRLG